MTRVVWEGIEGEEKEKKGGQNKKREGRQVDTVQCTDYEEV